MPVGKPSRQTIATEKYMKKAGWISKSYKIKREIAEDYAEACEVAGVSHAGQLMNMMKAFTAQVNREHSE